MSEFTILVEGLEIYAYHGVTDAEQAIGHRYGVDAFVQVVGNADVSDAVEESVDYAEVARILQTVISGSQNRTVERTARLACEALLAGLPLARQVRIRLTKLVPPMPFVAKAAGMEITLDRK